MSSLLIPAPEALADASSDLAGSGAAIREAPAAAAPSTTGIMPAAFDEVSAAITRLFGSYGQEFQALSAQSALFHGQFVQLLSSGGSAYAAAEVANVAATAMGAVPATAVQDPLTALVDFAQPFGIFSPVKAITGRSLFANGAAGAAGTASH